MYVHSVIVLDLKNLCPSQCLQKVELSKSENAWKRTTEATAKLTEEEKETSVSDVSSITRAGRECTYVCMCLCINIRTYLCVCTSELILDFYWGSCAVRTTGTGTGTGVKGSVFNELYRSFNMPERGVKPCHVLMLL